MVDRLYENMLELISKRQEQDCNSTLCNLNFVHIHLKKKHLLDCNSTLCNLNVVLDCSGKALVEIVIVHYVI